jgi:signal transduction histidine kinase
MAPQEEGHPGSSAAAHRLARLLRHEVGDLLQSVYSTVGILLERLPEALTMERRLISDLKGRAEMCKLELDAVVELAAPPAFAIGPVDLMTVVQSAQMHLRRRFPSLEVHLDAGPPARILSDPRTLSSVLNVLLLSLCQGPHRHVSLRVQADAEHAECVIQRDGFGVTKEQLGWLEEPFATTQQALFGVGLALVQRLVKATGGTLTADNPPEGGVRVCVRFPLATDV